ncbi:MAG: FeoA family protein, partial [Anaerolineales bacterium]
MEPENKIVCPLIQIKPGERARMVGLRGGKGLVGRLTSLGFTPGVEISMVQNFGRGPLIVSVRDTRVALGRG